MRLPVVISFRLLKHGDVDEVVDSLQSVQELDGVLHHELETLEKLSIESVMVVVEGFELRSLAQLLKSFAQKQGPNGSNGDELFLQIQDQRSCLNHFIVGDCVRNN